MANAKCLICSKDLKTEEQFGFKYLCGSKCIGIYLKGGIAEKPENQGGGLIPEPIPTLNVGQVAGPSPTVKYPPCRECGGPKRGRGWTHIKTCSLRHGPKDKSERKTCPLCGGKARGSGFQHRIDCKLVELAKKLAF